MSSSTSQPHRGVIFDTNVVSKLAKVNRLDLLRRIFTAARAGVQLNLVLISHDRKVINHCNRAGIACIRLTSLLDGNEDSRSADRV